MSDPVNVDSINAPPAAALTSAQAAARLGVLPQTLYAYVSRGLVRRLRTPSGSRFDPLEIERLARERSNRARREPGAQPMGGAPLGVIETEVALVEDSELYLRGMRASDLAARCSFESAGGFLLTGRRDRPLRPDPGIDGEAVPPALRRPDAALPLLARMQIALIAVGAVDPLRQHVEHLDAVAAADGILGAMLAAVVPGGRWEPGASTASALWPALTEQAPPAGALRCLETALVLLMDHDLAPSTYAVRVAASARAALPSAVLAGLATLDSALHGRAAPRAARLLADVVGGADPRAALAAATVAEGGGIPGFGHPLYAGPDPRATALLGALAAVEDARTVLGAVATLRTIVLERTGRHPNVDLALAALTAVAGMRPDAPTAIFAVGRSVGWVAHAIAEYAEPPLRLRPVGRYVERAAEGSAGR